MITALLFLALAADYPQATISNGSVTAKLMLPDPEKGSYRGTRFDWSGIIASLTYKQSRIFRPVVSQARSEDSRLHHRSGGGVSIERRRARLC